MIKRSFFGGTCEELARIEVDDKTKIYYIDGGNTLIEVSKENFISFISKFSKSENKDIKKEYNNIMSLV